MRTKMALGVMWLVVALAAANILVGCVSEADPGSSLNPQPLPPVQEPTPPGREGDELPAPEQAGAFGGSSSSSGSTTAAPDAGADDADTNSN